MQNWPKPSLLSSKARQPLPLPQIVLLAATHHSMEQQREVLQGFRHLNYYTIALFFLGKLLVEESQQVKRIVG